MERTKTNKHDLMAHLGTPEELLANFKVIFRRVDIDAAFILKALFDIVEAKDMEQPLFEAALARNNLYKILGGELTSALDEMLRNLSRSNRRW